MVHDQGLPGLRFKERTMASGSSIEWTESTWNPVTGCTRISAGCAHCYAERMARRLQAMGQPNYRNGFKVTCHHDRIDDLRGVPAAVRFLSLEPLLGPLPNLDLGGIGWVIVGGESGPGARPMEADWAADIRDQCLAANVPFFFKQWGGVQKKKAGRLLDRRTWDQMPQSTKGDDHGKAHTA